MRILYLADNPQTGNAAYLSFSARVQFQPFFGQFLLLLGCKTNFIKFWIKFWIKQVKFLPVRSTSLVQRHKLVLQNSPRFFKNFKKHCGLYGLIKLELLQETFSLTIILHWKVRKNQKLTKGPSFDTTCEFITWLLTLRRRMPHICDFLVSQFQPFFVYSLSFLDLKTKLIKFWTKFWIR